MVNPAKGFEQQGLARARGSHKREERALPNAQRNRPQGKAGKSQLQIFDVDHDAVFLGCETTRRNRKKSMETRMSSTATGCEYVRP